MKKLFIKIKDWFVRHKPSKRKVIQVYTALLYNANLKGFIKGDIFKGKSKVTCVPGLNCYSCPGAIGSCPLGSLQGAVAKADKSMLYYVVGTLLLYGLIFGRTICGWLCPVGLCQELVYKVNSPKVKKSKYTRLLSYFKYFLLVILVIMIPIITAESVPGFCKLICPAGIFEGSFSILSNNTHLLSHLGPIFTWKFILFIIILILCIFIYRCFCRFLCPLGAIYGLFNKFNILGVKVNRDTCIDCGLCVKECKMDIRVVGDHECINCGECIPVCPTKAIQWKGKKFILPPNEISTPLEENDTNLVNSQEEAKSIDNEPKNNKKKILKLITQISATLLLVGVLIYAYFGDKENTVDISNTTQAVEGQACKDFEITSINGKDNFSIENGKGKFTILNFWYINCSACISELPYFEEFYQDNKDDVNLIAINPVDQDIEYLTSWIDEKQSLSHTDLGYWIDWGLTFGVPNANDKLPEYFNFGDSYPATIFIDQEGIIKKIHYGAIEERQLVDYYNSYK